MTIKIITNGRREFRQSYWYDFAILNLSSFLLTPKMNKSIFLFGIAKKITYELKKHEKINFLYTIIK